MRARANTFVIVERGELHVGLALALALAGRPPRWWRLADGGRRHRGHTASRRSDGGPTAVAAMLPFGRFPPRFCRHSAAGPPFRRGTRDASSDVSRGA